MPLFLFCFLSLLKVAYSWALRVGHEFGWKLSVFIGWLPANRNKRKKNTLKQSSYKITSPKRNNPSRQTTSFQSRYDVVSTLKRRRFNVGTTSYRRWNDVVCLLGYPSKLRTENFTFFWRCEVETFKILK